MKKTVIALALAAAATTAQAESIFGGPDMEISDHWHTQIFANGWATKVETDLILKDAGNQLLGSIPGIPANDKIGLTEGSYSDTGFLLKNTDGLFLGGFHTTKGRFAVGGDLTWLSLNGSVDELGSIIGIDCTGRIPGNPDGPLGGIGVSKGLLCGIGASIAIDESKGIDPGSVVLDIEAGDLEIDYNVIEMVAHLGYRVTPELELYAGARWQRSHIFVKTEGTVQASWCDEEDVGSAGCGGLGNPLLNTVDIEDGSKVVDIESDWFDPMIGFVWKDNVSDWVYLTGEGNLAGGFGVNYAYEITGAVGFTMNENLFTEVGYRMYQYYVNDGEVQQAQKERGPQARLGLQF